MGGWPVLPGHPGMYPNLSVATALALPASGCSSTVGYECLCWLGERAYVRRAEVTQLRLGVGLPTW